VRRHGGYCWRVVVSCLHFLFVVVSCGGRVNVASVDGVSRQCSHGILYAHMDIQISYRINAPSRQLLRMLSSARDARVRHGPLEK